MRQKPMIRKMLIVSVLMLIIFATGIMLCSCSTSDKVNANITRQAQEFECERRVTVYNARTDTVIFQIEGFVNIETNAHSELVVTAKVGQYQYKKNYVYLNDYTLYVVEDITGTHTDPYHYKIIFNTSFPIDIETRP